MLFRSYFDKVLNNATYLEERDEYFIKSDVKIFIPDNLKNNILFICNNCIKLFTNVSVQKYWHALDWGMATCLTWILLKQNSAKVFIDMYSLTEFCLNKDKVLSQKD